MLQILNHDCFLTGQATQVFTLFLKRNLIINHRDVDYQCRQVDALTWAGGHALHYVTKSDVNQQEVASRA
jgi:hypothetical protein